MVFFSSEKPGEVEWNELNDLKRPLLLNYAMCKLQMKDFYSVIEHTSTVLKQEPGKLLLFEQFLTIMLFIHL